MMRQEVLRQIPVLDERESRSAITARIIRD